MCYVASVLSESIGAFLRDHVFGEEYKIRIYEKLPGIVYDYFKKEPSEGLPLYATFIVDSERPHEEFRTIRRIISERTYKV